MTYSALARPHPVITNRNNYRKNNRNDTANMSRTVIFVLLSCTLGLLYLVQITRTNALGYQLNDYRAEAAKLQAVHNDLELQAAKAQNLDRAEEYADRNGMVAIAP